MQAIALLHHGQHVIGRDIDTLNHAHGLLLVRVEGLACGVHRGNALLFEEAGHLALRQLHTLGQFGDFSIGLQCRLEAKFDRVGHGEQLFEQVLGGVLGGALCVALKTTTGVLEVSGSAQLRVLGLCGSLLGLGQRRFQRDQLGFEGNLGLGRHASIFCGVGTDVRIGVRRSGRWLSGGHRPISGWNGSSPGLPDRHGSDAGGGPAYFKGYGHRPLHFTRPPGRVTASAQPRRPGG